MYSQLTGSGKDGFLNTWSLTHAPLPTDANRALPSNPILTQIHPNLTLLPVSSPLDPWWGTWPKVLLLPCHLRPWEQLLAPFPSLLMLLLMFPLAGPTL